MRVKLVSVDPFHPPLNLEIDTFPAVIGKHMNANVQLQDRGMADRHCELWEQGGEIVVRHLVSDLGILVNGKPVTKALLTNGDKLTIGIRVLQIQYIPTTEAKPPTRVKARA